MGSPLYCSCLPVCLSVCAVSALRGDTWLPENLEGTDEQKTAWGQESVIEGHIDQVCAAAPPARLHACPVNVST